MEEEEEEGVLQLRGGVEGGWSRRKEAKAKERSSSSRSGTFSVRRLESVKPETLMLSTSCLTDPPSFFCSGWWFSLQRRRAARTTSFGDGLIRTGQEYAERMG